MSPGDALVSERELLAMIQELVEPDSWQQPGIYAKAVTGRLVIRHTDAAHRKITNLLIQLGVIWRPSRNGCILTSPIPIVGSTSESPTNR